MVVPQQLQFLGPGLLEPQHPNRVITFGGEIEHLDLARKSYPKQYPVGIEPAIKPIKPAQFYFGIPTMDQPELSPFPRDGWVVFDCLPLPLRTIVTNRDFRPC